MEKWRKYADKNNEEEEDETFKWLYKNIVKKFIQDSCKQVNSFFIQMI